MSQQLRSTIEDVAALAKAAVPTCYHALRGTGRLAPETRQRIQAAAARLAFQFDRRGRSLANGKVGIIGVLYGQRYPCLSGFGGHLLEMIAARLATLDHHLLLMPAPDDGKELRRQLSDGRIDACLATQRCTGDMALALAQSGRPHVVLNDDPEGTSSPRILFDDHAAVSIALGLLTSLGHHRIAYLPSASDPTHYSFAARLRAFRELCPHGMILDHDLGTAVRSLSEGKDRVSAVLAYDDRAACHFIQACGMPVPHRLSVVGINDEPAATLIAPQLTTIHLPIEDMAREAVDRLMQALAGDPEPARTSVLTGRLILRGSTAPVG